MTIQTALTSKVNRSRLLSLVAAALLAEAISLGAQLLFGVRLEAPAGTVASDPVEIGPLTIAIASLAPALAGWAVLACLERLTPHARRTWLAMALVVFIASLFAPLSGTSVTPADRVVLVLMHLAVAGTVIGALYRTSAGRLADLSQASLSSGTAARPPLLAKGPHAAHRPPVHTDPQQSKPPLVFGVLYPRDDVVAVIDDLDQARRAEAALHTAGISDEDSDVLEPQWVIEAHRDIDRRRGWFGRMAAGVSALASDESHYMQTYLDAAERGHALVVVHAPTPTVVEHVRQVLVAHGAHGMRHYGRLTVTELS